MANTNAPNGFQYFGRLEGGSPTAGNSVRLIESTDTAIIGMGDPVVSLNTGYITLATAGTTQIAGIFMGCEYLNTAVGRVVWSNYWPGGTQGSNATAYICTDPQAQFVVQSNNTAIAFGDIGNNVQFALGTVNTTTGFSGATINQSTIATTDTLPFRIVGLLSQYVPAGGAGGLEASAYNRAIVVANYWDRKSLVGI